MPRIRTCLAYLLLFATVLATACAAPQPNVPDARAPTEARRNTADPASVVTVSFAAFESDRKTFAPYIAAFERAHPDIRIAYVPIDDKDDREVAEAADTAHLFQMPGPDVVQQNLFLDLAPFIAGDAGFQPDDFYPGVLDAVQLNGQQLMLPTTMTLPLLEYNQQLWAARGLTPPQPDWTWDDLLAAAEQLAQVDDGTVEAYGLLDASFRRTDFEVFRVLAAQEGTDPYGAPPEQLRLDEPPFINALAQTAALVQSGALYRQQDDGRERLTLIEQGQAGIWAAGSAGIAIDNLEVGLAAVPARPDGQGDSRPMGGYVISSGTRFPDAAWRWLSFLSQQVPPNNLVGPSAGRNVVPVRPSLVAQSGLLDRLDAEEQAVLEAVLARPIGPPRFFTAEEVQIRNAIGTALDTALDTEQSAQAALEAAQAELTTALAQVPVATPSPTADPQPVVVATPLPLPPPGAASLQFGTTAAQARRARASAETFNQQPDVVSVNISDIEPDASTSRLAAQVDCWATGTAPTQDSDTSGLLNLQPLLDADAAFPAGDLPPVLLAPFQRDGNLLGLPTTVTLPTLGYNQQRLDNANLDPLSANATMNDVLATALQLTSGQGANQQFGYAAASATMTADLDWALRRFGAALATTSGTPTLTSPTVVEAAQWYVTLVQDTSPHTRLTGYTATPSADPAAGLIEAGRVALWLNLPGGGAPQPAAALTPVRGPAPLGVGLTAADVRTSGLYISATSEQMADCWTFLKAFSANAASLDHNGGGALTLPARQSVAQDGQTPDEQVLVAAYRQALSEADGGAAERNPFPRYWFYQAVDTALQGADLEQELAAAQRITEAYLACVEGGTSDDCARQVDPDYAGFNQPDR